jgi:hypothetical protein
MLLSISPLTYILAAIWPIHFTLSSLEVISVISHVNSTIWPIKSPESIHSVSWPSTCKITTVDPSELAMAFEVVQFEFPLVDGPILHLVRSIPMFEHVIKFTLVDWAVGPLVNSFAVRLVIHPISAVVWSIRQNIWSVTVRLIAQPVSFI